LGLWVWPRPGWARQGQKTPKRTITRQAFSVAAWMAERTRNRGPDHSTARSEGQ